MHSPVTSAPASAKHSATRACQLASGIGVTGGGGGGGGDGGDGGGDGGRIVSRVHALIGPSLSQLNFSPKAFALMNTFGCTVVAPKPCHIDISRSNAFADSNIDSMF